MSNVASILSNGLQPQIGPRSAARGVTVPGVFFYTSLESVESALTNWLGEEFQSNPGPIAVLAIDALGLALESVSSFELASRHPISANKISLAIAHD